MKSTKKIPFYKMQGSGNDFILIDNRRGVLKGCNLKDLARTVCHRRFSVGADGLIVIVPSRRADFKWRFFNADGSEAEMCGNGSRCAARFAYIKKIAPRKMAFETLAGVIHAEVMQERVNVQLTGAGDLRKEISVDLEGGVRSGHFINTGVPHLVYLSDNVEGEDVQAVGRTTRHHDLFTPAGTNVNFIQVQGTHSLNIRTYERGVEGETLACGTGAVAAALIAASLGAVSSPVVVQTRGGEELTIFFTNDGETFGDIHLEGAVKVICEGVLYA
ncbi:MAG TPA: diaminopimelate epimerase [Nitrospiraceae bacterium]|nr:diaminopimelate epimerase [Nitrospiraceae bacterium]